MNLIPTSAVFRQAQGGTADLPTICQYLSLVVQSDEQVILYQSGMFAAFYPFRIPRQWSRMMCFNVRFLGQDIGLQRDVCYRPGCAVIPMGWASAVSIMQEIADSLTCIGTRRPVQESPCSMYTWTTVAPWKKGA